MNVLELCVNCQHQDWTQDESGGTGRCTHEDIDLHLREIGRDLCVKLDNCPGFKAKENLQYYAQNDCCETKAIDVPNDTYKEPVSKALSAIRLDYNIKNNYAKQPIGDTLTVIINIRTQAILIKLKDNLIGVVDMSLIPNKQNLYPKK